MRQFRTAFRLALAVFVVGYSLATAQAAFIVNHLGVSPPPPNADYNFWQCSFSATDHDLETGRQGNRTYDDFMVSPVQFPAGADITRFKWQMTVGDNMNPANNPPGPLLATSYRVQFWSNQQPLGQKNQPGTSLFSAELPAAAVQTTFRGLSHVGDDFDNFAYYDMSFDLPQSFHAAPNTLYWVSWMTFTPTFRPGYAWYGDANGGQVWSDRLDVTGTPYQRLDLAGGSQYYTLEGTATVPEPSTWVLLTLAAVGGKLARRRRIASGRFAPVFPY